MNRLLAGSLIHVVGHIGQDAFGHVFDALQKSHAEIWNGLFLFGGHGPEAVGENVVLDRTEPLNRTISTVVVGQNQPLVRNDFRSAATAV